MNTGCSSSGSLRAARLLHPQVAGDGGGGGFDRTGRALVAVHRARLRKRARCHGLPLEMAGAYDLRVSIVACRFQDGGREGGREGLMHGLLNEGMID